MMHWNCRLFHNAASLGNQLSQAEVAEEAYGLLAFTICEK